MQYEDLRQLCADPRARATVLADMDSIGKEAQVYFFSLTHLKESGLSVIDVPSYY